MDGEDKQVVEVPGIGSAGVVMCPLTRGACMKGGCEWWMELNYAEQKVARCSVAWLSRLTTEVRASIDKLGKGEVNGKKETTKSKETVL